MRSRYALNSITKQGGRSQTDHSTAWHSHHSYRVRIAVYFPLLIDEGNKERATVFSRPQCSFRVLDQRDQATHFIGALALVHQVRQGVAVERIDASWRGSGIEAQIVSLSMSPLDGMEDAPKKAVV